MTSNLKSCCEGSGHELCKCFNDHWKKNLHTSFLLIIKIICFVSGWSVKGYSFERKRTAMAWLGWRRERLSCWLEVPFLCFGAVLKHTQRGQNRQMWLTVNPSSYYTPSPHPHRQVGTIAWFWSLPQHQEDFSWRYILNYWSYAALSLKNKCVVYVPLMGFHVGASCYRQK